MAEAVQHWQTADATLKATQDILSVISRARDDEKPVFDAILDNATELCDADSASLLLESEDRTRTILMAQSGAMYGFEFGVQSWPIHLGHAQTEAARTGKVVQETDLRDSKLYRDGDPTRTMLVDEIGLRTALWSPRFSAT